MTSEPALLPVLFQARGLGTGAVSGCAAVLAVVYDVIAARPAPGGPAGTAAPRLGDERRLERSLPGSSARPHDVIARAPDPASLPTAPRRPRTGRCFRVGRAVHDVTAARGVTFGSRFGPGSRGL